MSNQLSDLLGHLPILPTFAHVPWKALTLYGLGGLVAVVALAMLWAWPYRAFMLPFKNLRGPIPDTFWLGSLTRIIKEPPLAPHTNWIKEYGLTYRYRLFFGTWRFFTADPTAINYILHHADLFPKSGIARRDMEEILGRGLLVVEGDDHKRQRKILNPSFSLAAVKQMVPTFYEKAYELRDKLVSMVEDQNGVYSPSPAQSVDVVPGAKKIDVMRYLTQATIDVIGAAGFDYDFQALKQENNELAAAYRDLFSTTESIDWFAVLQALVPIFKIIPTERVKKAARSTKTTKRIGARILAEKKAAVRKAHAGGLEKGDEIGKDLMSILVRANMASDVRPEQRMTDDEVLAQITTFMLAGNETSSTALTWILYNLAMRPDIQDKLRAEVSAVQDERPDFDALAAMPYLDKVIREGLRLFPPAPATVRMAAEKATIPLGTPVEGRDGTLIDSVHLPKGSVIFVPIMCVNTSTAIWGPDAAKFHPDRFDNLPAESNAVPGVWGNLMTFLGGTRNCIGYRFALAEIRAFLFVLLRSFTFDELPSKPEFEKKAAIVMRSRVKGEEKLGFQMPLLVKPVA